MNGTAVPEPESSPAGSRTSPWRSRWSLRYLPIAADSAFSLVTPFDSSSSREPVIVRRLQVNPASGKRADCL